MRREKGITLIALIITIIVLLILAGVTIATLTGENGILTKADIAEQETKKQEAKERVQVEVMASYDNNGKISLEELNDNLKKNIEGLTYEGKPIAEDNKIEALPAIVVVNGYKVKIHENGKVTIDGENGDSEETPTPPTPEEPEAPKTVTDAKEKNEPLSTTENTTIVDNFGNQVVVPAGFKIGSDSATDVTGGVVIEDVSHTNTAGSEFVWIPVGTVYTNEAKTESKTINLNRYTFAEDGTATPQAENVIAVNIGVQFNNGDYTVNFEELAESNWGNAVALNIAEFKTKAVNNHGYYIGRYEARTAIKSERAETKKDNGEQLTVRKDDYIYNWITEPEAARLSQGMYSGDSNFTSDLINSYAWDTAVVFVQTFDNRTNKTKPYSRLSSLNTGSLATQGTNNLSDTTKQDKICNIWDMASNEVEWTTETGKDTGTSCSDRGGQYPSNMNYTTVRDALSKTGSYVNVAFRPIIYM